MGKLPTYHTGTQN
ncbi:hypothetical protein M8C21_026676 [Ambrosia artemisiifolia]|uniref:Uncharacterized protein n=1 Tax=Ambrosia artemisiifolia TaxID=4212 RepID=A0AAD5D893_AMBAR|nr:hypothetical protein M8C21_026673 [Ambrosia artemisiifolia]KAI7754890.1 hypothetical protein M8C21_026676 [Ambrosia artemisiifolia]